MMYGFDNGFNCGGYGFVIPILLIVVIIFAAYKLFLNNNHVSNNDALNELNKKFVNGDISEEDYLKRKQILKTK
ncbi:MAG: hypothetical protein K0Q49_1601 [Haloplasmataceae bacterium]|jgi:putative membrane protein|nr:hypothetical protein [Haloplasmataceae bacterium]